MPLAEDHGALDLALSLGYTALLLVLVGLSYLSIARRPKRKSNDPTDKSRGL